jgi:hypothetical protein
VDLAVVQRRQREPQPEPRHRVREVTAVKELVVVLALVLVVAVVERRLSEPRPQQGLLVTVERARRPALAALL